VAQSACRRGPTAFSSFPRPNPIHHRARYRPGTEFISNPICPLLDFLLSFVI
jgi:hypothetical protein